MKTIKCKNGGSFEVDDKMASFLSNFVWRSDIRNNGRTYFYTTIFNKKIYLHRMIIGFWGSFVVDHKDRNSKNNSLENLKATTHNQNNFNIIKPRNSKYRGVHKNHKKWVAMLSHKYKVMRSWGHLTEESAARAYDEMARKIYGNDCITNFPLKGERPSQACERRMR